METHRVFAYLSGIIIVSGDKSIIDDLSANAKWVEYSHTHPTLARTFLSHDLVETVVREGLPKQVQKYLHTRI